MVNLLYEWYFIYKLPDFINTQTDIIVAYYKQKEQLEEYISMH